MTFPKFYVDKIWYDILLVKDLDVSTATVFLQARFSNFQFSSFNGEKYVCADPFTSLIFLSYFISFNLFGASFVGLPTFY